MKKKKSANASGAAKRRKSGAAARKGAPRRTQPAAARPAAPNDSRPTVRRLRSELAKALARVEELKASADTDFLLDILNRRGFERELNRSIAFIKRYHASGALVVLDVDRLKPINDEFGHAAGDQVLKAIVAALLREVRTSDVVGRLGGDEFAVLLWNLSETDARAKAVALEQTIDALSFEFRGRSVTSGASAGVAVLDAQRRGDAGTTRQRLGAAFEAVLARREALPDAGQPRQLLLVEVVEEAPAHPVQVQRARGLDGALTLRGQDGIRAAGVGRARRALDEAVAHQAVDQARQTAAAEHEPIGELAHAHPVIGGLLEAHEQVVGDQRETVRLLELAVQLAHEQRVGPKEAAPGGQLGRRQARDDGCACGGHRGSD